MNDQLTRIDFSMFVLSLATSANLHLRVIEPPAGSDFKPNLVEAQHTIDILAMLEEKTQGNLAPDENNLLTQVLYELRLAFVNHKK